MTGESWKVYWSEYAKYSHPYGTGLFFHARDDVEVRNELLPPGTVIKTWFSKVNYQAMRIEPALPMIDGEGKYHISLDVSADISKDGLRDASEKRSGVHSDKIADRLILKLIFYDRYDMEVESEIVRDGEGDFQCPLKTFSYVVQLINAGVTEFHFHSFTITEILEDETEEVEEEIEDGKWKIFSNLKKSKRRASSHKGAKRRGFKQEDG